MSKRAARVCPSIGCSNIVRGNDRYCSECKRTKDKEYNSRRDPRKRSGYGKEWKRIRADHLIMQPNCVNCGRLATEVDHIIPLARGGTNDHTNLRSMCKSCHSRKTASSDGGFGNRVIEKNSIRDKGV